MSAEFTLTELMYRVFKFLSSSHNESSLLHSSNSAKSALLTFYMNDIFKDFDDFKKQFTFLKNQFFSRIEWVRLRLTFKKLHLFAKFVKALNVIHEVNEYVRVLDERMIKIARWLTSVNFTDVRAFLKMINITRRWIKNFTKLIKSLIRLIDKKALWKWT